jgi:hypothetical protein
MGGAHDVAKRNTAKMSAKLRTGGEPGDANGDAQGGLAVLNKSPSFLRGRTMAKIKLIADGVPGVWNEGDVFLDLYEVKEVPGEGCMGRAYRVHHRRWNVDLAVTCPKAEYFATLDRLTHRCHILETRGDSYRLREAKRRRGGKRNEGSDGAQEGDEEGRD